MDIEKKFQEIVSTSGNAFHSRVAGWLKSNGWTVMVSPYYMDHGQGKAREIDIIAEKVCHRRESFRHKTIIVVVRLYIECKFVSVPSVFWFADREQKLVEELVCESGPFRMDNTRTMEHHYLAGPRSVAKVFASATGREPDNEPFYRALNQVLNARGSMREMNSFVQGLPERSTFAFRRIEFPVVVFDSLRNLRKVQFYGESKIEPIPENFQLEVRYAYNRADGTNRSEYLLVDFVEFDRLEIYCKSLNVDAEVVGHLA